MRLPDGVRAWREAGRFLEKDGVRVFVVDRGPRSDRAVLILHGFPSSTYDWARVVPDLAADVRVLAFDFLGYGFSDKPFDGDASTFSIFRQADLAEAVLADAGIRAALLVSHDLGQTVGAELMARHEEGRLPVELTGAVVTNGSTFIDMAELTDGQRALLALPDEPLTESLDLEAFRPGLLQTFSREHPPPEEELDAMLAGIRHGDGDRLLPRLIRYVDERRANRDRWTEGLVGFRPPMSVRWGAQDPVAVVTMTERIRELRPETDVVVWPDVGHWPSIEVPERMAAAIRERL